MEYLYNLLMNFLLSLPFVPVSANLKTDAIKYGVDRVRDMLNNVSSLGSSMCDILCGGAGSSSSFITTVSYLLKSYVVSGISAMAAVGVTIALGLWMFNIVELAVQDRLTPETLIKSLARLVFAATLCDIAGTVYSGIYDFGTAFGTDVKNAFSALSPTSVNNTISDVCTNLEGLPEDDWGTWISIYVDTTLLILPVYLFSGIILAVCYVIQVTRVIELHTRGLFLPIAFGMLADDGWKGAGGRYIRKFIAICAQAGVLIAIGMITSYIMAQSIVSLLGNATAISGLNDIFNAVVLILGVGVGCLAILFKSIGIVNDVFGA